MNYVGNCKICSSEEETLIALRNNLISEKIDFLRKGLKNSTAKTEKQEHKKESIKRFLKMQKEIEKYFSTN